MFGILTYLKRRRLLKQAFPDAWLQILHDNCEFFAELEGAERQRFLKHTYLFAKMKYFFGVQGLDITDTIRVVISAQAARLVRNMPYNIYDGLTEIVVYPSHYVHKDKDGIILGEAHRWGVVVLSWDAVKGGLHHPHDGHDTAIHEFAHVLDNIDGVFDGTPPLDRDALRAWVVAFSAAFDKLRKNPQRKHRVIREYGATNEAEFFAVATESFFEKPRQLRRHYPKVYAALRSYYRIDPARH